nr:hypothetical protein [Amycolatopsis pretoriensis]
MPLFVSDRTLRRYKTLPVASCDWACDSGGFSQLSRCGTWACGPSPREYAARIRRYRDEIGRLLWAAPQDHMCEDTILARTGLDVAQHQELTINNYLQLRSLDSELPFIPVLQGQTIEDYHRCADRYEQRGVDLAVAPVVGVGSICRRQHTAEVEGVVRSLAQRGYRLHAFGAKTLGLARYADNIVSSDSLAWSFAARWEPPLAECRGHRRCNNCVKFALRWRQKILRTIGTSGNDMTTAA